MSVETRTPRAPLRDVHETWRVVPYLNGLAARKSYIWFVATSNLRRRNINTILGNLWHLLNPLLQIAIYYLIFGLLLKTTRGVDNFILFLTVGVFTFGLTQRSTTAGSRSIVGNRGLIKSVKFPRAMLPITAVVTETLATVPMVMLIYVVAGLTGQAPRWEWVLLPAMMSVQVVFNLGTALVAARLTTHVPDTTQILPFVFRLLFYASGVLFNVTSYAEGRYRWLFILNPMYCFITIGRWTILGTDVEPVLFVVAAAWTVGLLMFGFLWFRRAEESYGRD